MTDLRDRDDVIDRWLRKAASASGPGPNAACLDAEVMAAWADGGLSDAALRTVRAHVADCSRCQVLAAVMTKLEPVGAGAADPRPGRAPARHPWLNWLVPLAAAAGAVAIWFFIPRQPPAFEQAAAPASQMAQVKPAEPAAPAPLQAPTTAAELPTRVPSAPKLKAEAQAPRDASQAANEKDQNRQALGRAEEVRERTQAVADLKKVDTRTVAAPPPASPPPPAVAQPAAVAPPAAASALGQASADRGANVAGRAGTGVGGGGGRGGGGGSRAALSAESRLAKEIVSTDDATRWRITGGVVEKSTDAGRVWSPVKTGVTAEFTAGASPSPNTCWLVGLGGVVLLTTDGQTWERLKFPDTTDLSSVRATDSRTATVTTADGREYSTIDGGNTWVRR